MQRPWTGQWSVSAGRENPTGISKIHVAPTGLLGGGTVAGLPAFTGSVAVVVLPLGAEEQMRVLELHDVAVEPRIGEPDVAAAGRPRPRCPPNRLTARVTNRRLATAAERRPLADLVGYVTAWIPSPAPVDVDYSEIQHVQVVRHSPDVGVRMTRSIAGSGTIPQEEESG